MSRLLLSVLGWNGVQVIEIETCSQTMECGEFFLIDQLKSRLAKTLKSGNLGVGDDCAVVQLADSEAQLLLTTDSLVEERHFSRRFCSAADIGARALAVSVSDVAAMGGTPDAALVSLHIPQNTESDFILELYDGLAEVASRYGVSVVGGDTVASNEFVINVTLLGFCSSKPILRSGADVGDQIWISGPIGAAGAGLRFLRGESVLSDTLRDRVKEAYLRPCAQVALGEKLSALQLASSMLDVSDGLLQDAAHIAVASNANLLLRAEQIPFWDQKIGDSPQDAMQACTCGDDYQLLWTSPPECSEQIRALQESSEADVFAESVCIGEVKSGGAQVLFDHSPWGVELAREAAARFNCSVGYDHFAGGGDGSG